MSELTIKTASLHKENIHKDVVQSLTFKVANEWFCLPITSVKDVMYAPQLTSVPLSPCDVAGLINIRGHIVTALYMAKFLEIDGDAPEKPMCLVIQDKDDELYSFIVDKVSDIEGLKLENFENLPVSLHTLFSSVATGVFREEGRLIIALNKEKMMAKIV